MGNPKPEKVAQVKEVKTRLDAARSVVVTEYRGLSVDDLSALRTELRNSGGYYKVYKNTLVRRAASEAGLDLDDILLGPTALAFTEKKPDGSEGDVVTVAKTLRDFGKKHPELVIKGGYFDGSVIDADEVKSLADIEPREVLLAKFAGLLAAPMQQFAGLLQALPRDFAYGLQALIEKGGASEAAADETPTEDAEVATSESKDSEDAEASEDVEGDKTPEVEAKSAETNDENVEENEKKDEE